MLTNCLAACAHLTITVSEIERDLWKKLSFYHTPLHSTPLLGGSRRNIATPFGMEKLYKMVGLPDGGKNFDNMCNRLGQSRRVTDRQMDGHLATAYTRYAYASRSKKARSSAVAERQCDASCHWIFCYVTQKHRAASLCDSRAAFYSADQTMSLIKRQLACHSIFLLQSRRPITISVAGRPGCNRPTPLP